MINSAKLQRILNWNYLLIILVILNILAIIYVVFGFGTVTVDKPANALLYLNENSKGTVDSLTLRPGKYTIRIADSSVTSNTFTVTLWPFSSQTIKAEDTSTLQIFKDASGSPYIGGDYSIVSESVFDNNWLIAKYSNSKNDNTITVAFRYMFDKWNTIIYYPNESSDYTIDEQLNKLPTDVALKFDQLRKVSDED